MGRFTVVGEQLRVAGVPEVVAGVAAVRCSYKGLIVFYLMLMFEYFGYLCYVTFG